MNKLLRTTDDLRVTTTTILCTTEILKRMVRFYPNPITHFYKVPLCVEFTEHVSTLDQIFHDPFTVIETKLHTVHRLSCLFISTIHAVIRLHNLLRIIISKS